MKKKEESLTKNFNRLKIDIINILTDEPYEIPLKKFFKRRQKRVM